MTKNERIFKEEYKKIIGNPVKGMEKRREIISNIKKTFPKEFFLDMEDNYPKNKLFITNFSKGKLREKMAFVDKVKSTDPSLDFVIKDDAVDHKGKELSYVFALYATDKKSKEIYHKKFNDSLK